jgi:hypothetical protein
MSEEAAPLPEHLDVETKVAEVDPEHVIPLEAARAHLRHWWREPVAGLIAVVIGSFDSWYYGHDQGLSSSLDEILVIGGIVLMAGSRRLFAGPPALTEPNKDIKR